MTSIHKTTFFDFLICTFRFTGHKNFPGRETTFTIEEVINNLEFDENTKQSLDFWIEKHITVSLKLSLVDVPWDFKFEHLFPVRMNNGSWVWCKRFCLTIGDEKFALFIELGKGKVCTKKYYVNAGPNHNGKEFTGFVDFITFMDNLGLGL